MRLMMRPKNTETNSNASAALFLRWLSPLPRPGKQSCTGPGGGFARTEVRAEVRAKVLVLPFGVGVKLSGNRREDVVAEHLGGSFAKIPSVSAMIIQWAK